MKVVIALLALLAIAVTAPLNPETDAQIVKQILENTGVDNYHFAIETSNGISHEEQGSLVNAGGEHEDISVTGSFKYLGPDGVEYEVNYIADDKGFRPHGDHLPKRNTKCFFGCDT